jgi:hypothetical protein
MAFPNLQREAARARNSYLGAVRRWHAAGEAFEAATVPLLPSSAGVIREWTAYEATVMQACAQAWTELVACRRGYDAALEDLAANEPATQRKRVGAADSAKERSRVLSPRR